MYITVWWHQDWTGCRQRQSYLSSSSIVVVMQTNKGQPQRIFLSQSIATPNDSVTINPYSVPEWQTFSTLCIHHIAFVWPVGIEYYKAYGPSSYLVWSSGAIVWPSVGRYLLDCWLAVEQVKAIFAQNSNLWLDKFYIHMVILYEFQDSALPVHAKLFKKYCIRRLLNTGVTGWHLNFVSF